MHLQHRSCPTISSDIFLQELQLSGGNFVDDQLTSPPLLNLRRYYRKNGENFHHDFQHDVDHRLRWWKCCIGLKALEKVLNALEEIDEHLLACIDILGRLSNDGIMKPCILKSRLTKRRTPIPAKITFAGENTLETMIRTQIPER